MDRTFYQLTVLAATACVGAIALSILFPASRQVNSSTFSPDVANKVTIIEVENP